MNIIKQHPQRYKSQFDENTFAIAINPKTW